MGNVNYSEGKIQFNNTGNVFFYMDLLIDEFSTENFENNGYVACTIKYIPVSTVIKEITFNFWNNVSYTEQSPRVYSNSFDPGTIPNNPIITKKLLNDVQYNSGETWYCKMYFITVDNKVIQSNIESYTNI